MIAVPIALFCVLTSAYAKDLCLLPALLPLVLPSTDPFRIAFAAFVIVAIFKIVAALVSHQKGGL